MAFERKYTDAQRERAIALVAERLEQDPKDRSIIRDVAAELGVGEQSVRVWVRKSSLRATAAAGPASDPADDSTPLPAGIPGVPESTGDRALDELRQEIAGLRGELVAVREENDILKKAFKIFTSDWAK